MDEKNNNQIVFLDTLVHRDINNHLVTTVYRKPTHIDQYLAIYCHHPEYIKSGVVGCLYDRASNIVTKPRCTATRNGISSPPLCPTVTQNPLFNGSWKLSVDSPRRSRNTQPRHFLRSSMGSLDNYAADRKPGHSHCLQIKYHNSELFGPPRGPQSRQTWRNSA